MPGVTEKFLVEFRIPDINGDRCVHAHIETASCKACVDACPENAWILDDESLGLNTNACDGCGLCVPACTEGAITQTRDCTIREENKQKVLLLGCEHTGLDESNCKCIHAVSYNDLLSLYRDGLHQIYTAVGDCAQCTRGKNEHLSRRLGNINKMLSQQEMLPMQYKELPATRWQQLWKTPEKSAPGPEMSRRTFFRSALKQTVDIVLHQSSFDNTGEFTPPGKILPATQEIQDKGQVYPAVPQINPVKCNGCNACIRSCPHDALQLKQEESLSSYQINASACTGCNICVDICDQDAIQVAHWSILKNNTILLNANKCKSCGALFHQPRQNSNEEKSNKEKEEQPLCNICSQIDHQKHLFQVLD